jgi:hypothetical protein
MKKTRSKNSRDTVPLKVVGNEKLGGLKFLQLLGIGLGPWRSISIFILNMPFANTKRISVSALSSKIGDLFAIRRCGSNKIFLLTTRQFICAPNVRSVKREAARIGKKSARSNMVITGAPILIRIAICAGRLQGAGMFCPSYFICGQNRSFLFITLRYIDATKLYA